MDSERSGSRVSEFDPERVFELLGNETRMEILRALWNEYDPFAEANGLRFSDLYDRVDIDDSGKFNYHLKKLRDRYVQRTDDQYRLSPVGLRLVQSVIAGAGQTVSFDPTEVAAECRLCGAPIELHYDGGRVYYVCTECGGNFDSPEYPDGTLWGETMPPTGVRDRSPQEIVATASFLDWPHKAMLTAKICPRCTGVLHESIEICETHEPRDDGPCPACGYTHPVRVNWLCTTCKFHGAGTPLAYIKNHPAVIAFRYDHGIDFGYPYTKSEFEETQTQEAIREEMEYDLQVDSKDPLRLRATVGYEDDSIQLTLDEGLAVTAVSREAER